MNRQRAAWAIAATALALSMIIIIVAILVAATKSTEIRDAQQANTKTIENTQATLDLIRDCTQPEGECYQRSQDSTAEVVDNIGLLSTYAAACADQPEQQTAEEIRACVLDLLDHPRTKR